MSTIYEIKGEIFELMELMEEDPENEIIKDTLEALQGELEIKAEGYCKIIREFEGKVSMVDAEMDRLNQKKQTYTNNIHRLKDTLLNAMLDTGHTKIKGDLFSLTVRKNAPQLADLPETLPDKYLIPQDPKIDKRLLLSDVKSGVEVKGVTLKQSQSLLIK